MSEWISVKDRLPEPEKKVVVVSRDLRTGKIDIHLDMLSKKKRSGNQTWYVSPGLRSEVIYWLNIPEPPKGE